VRVIVTGATGFVGRWLVAELQTAGHEVVGDPAGSRTDVTLGPAVARWVAASAPDAVIHLAAVAAPRDVEADPGRALALAVGGTANVIDALAHGGNRHGSPPILLVSGSSEVYGAPEPGELPFAETAPVRPRTAYALTKLAQESVALAHGVRTGLRVVVTRSFNHTGPGQRETFAVPAFAQRILAAQETGSAKVPVGNLDVCRDLTDVRDVVVAYRRLIEVAAARATPGDGLIVNVGSGRCVAMREVVARLAAIAGVVVEPVIEAALVREGEPVEVRADITRITGLTGWLPTIALDTTLRDVLAAARSAAVQPP
jgi:GDP-4-dehydro-6-deoxy-D-mannose reductase